MFIGHFGVGFAAKRVNESVSLGTTFIAAQFIDLLWPIFVLIGVEKVAIDPGNTAFTPLDFYYYPFSHSMVGVLFWAVLLGVIYYLIRKNKRGALLVGALVFSHWILDLITHRPDLQIIPGVTYRLGFGLWNSVAGTIIIEGLIYFAGVYLFLRTYKQRNKIKRAGLLVLILILLFIYIANIFGPPPPSVEAIGFSGLAMWLFVAWAYWVDSKPGKENAQVLVPEGKA